MVVVIILPAVTSIAKGPVGNVPAFTTQGLFVSLYFWPVESTTDTAVIFPLGEFSII